MWTTPNPNLPENYESPKPLTVGKLIEFFKDYDLDTIVGYKDYEADISNAYDIEYVELYKMIVIE